MGLLLVPTARSQNYLANVSSYNIEDGLLHREVNDIYEDCSGIMWFATKRGLNSFDGHNFQDWTKEENGLLTNHVGEIFEDAHHNLWLIPFNYKGGNISIFNHKTHQLTSLKEKYGSQLPHPCDDISTNILVTKNKYVFISFKNSSKLTVISPENLVKTYEYDFGSILNGTETTDSTIWAVADDKWLVNIKTNGEIKSQYLYTSKIITKNFSSDLKSRPIFHTIENDNNYLTENGSFIKTNKGEFPLAANWYSRMRDLVVFNEKDELYWIYNQVDAKDDPSDTSLHKILLVDDQGNIIYDLLANYYELSEIGNRDFFVDSRGVTWIGGNFGVSAIELRSNKFKTYLMNNQVKNSKDNYSCRAMHIQDSLVFVNLEHNGLFQLDLKTGDERKLLPNEEELNNWYMGLGCSKSKLFVGRENIISIYNVLDHTNQDINLKYSNTIIPWSFRLLNEEKLMVGTERGTFSLDLTTNQLSEFNQYNDFNTLKSSHIYFIEEIHNGNLFICSNTGLYEFDHEEGIVARYWTGGDSTYQIPHDEIYHFFEDNDEVYWLATGGGGLIKWDRRSNKVFQYTKSEGLSNEVIYAVYPDEYNFLWLASDYGIIRLNKETYNSRAYMPVDGISHQEFNRISHFQSNEGNIYFGSLNGITEIIPDNFKNDSLSFNIPLVITEYYQYDEKLKKLVDKQYDIDGLDEILIRPRDGFFRLQFALLHYLDMDKVNYAYQIEGIEEDWNYQKENYIQLSGLPYGKFNLKIKGQMPNGQWSRNELSIPINVQRPFYAQWWFRILAALFFMFIGPAAYFYQGNRLKRRQRMLENRVEQRTQQIRKDKDIIEKQSEELRQLDRVKSRFFTNVTHELRTPLSLMLGPIGSVIKDNSIDQKNIGLLKMAQKNGKNLLNLVNEILDLSKMDSGKLSLHVTPILMHHFLYRLFAQYESYAVQKGIKLSFKYQAAHDLQLLLDKGKMEKVYNNLLSNAFKYSDESDEINILFQELDQYIRLEVSDTGPGIYEEDIPYIFERFYQSKHPEAKTAGGTGIGLAVCAEYVKLHGGEITVESHMGNGTSFSIIIPKKTPDILPEGLSEEPLQQIEFNNLDETADTEDESLSGTRIAKSRILIVEDNYDLNKYLKVILSDEYLVDTAFNGVEALNLLSIDEGHHSDHKLKYDLIVSDIMMPVMDGFEFLEKIKSSSTWRGVPIIMLTARTALQDKLSALRIGVDDYMYKPFEEEELLARVRNLLKNYYERSNHLQLNDNKEDITDIPNAESDWLAQLEAFTMKRFKDYNLTADILAKEMALSRTQFFRKIKSLTGLTPSQYVKEIRFNQARTILENKSVNSVKEVAYEVGYKQVKHFSQEFKKRFGKSPSEYLK